MNVISAMKMMSTKKMIKTAKLLIAEITFDEYANCDTYIMTSELSFLKKLLYFPLKMGLSNGLNSKTSNIFCL